MPYRLKDKTILIVSPQSWYTRSVSKMHYGNALAKNNTVFFLNPPQYGKVRQMPYKLSQIREQLVVVDWFIPFSKVIKFKVKWLDSLLLKHQLKKIVRAIPTIDVLWDFDNCTYFRFSNLTNASLKIWHLVDDFTYASRFNKKDYHLALAVSKSIIAKIPLPLKYNLGHAVAPSFVESFTANRPAISKPITVGYLGNLSIRFLDTEVFKQLISSFGQLKFKLIGDLEKESNWGNFLISSSNVEITGLKKGQELIKELKSCDLFLILYKRQKGYLGDNSHKILEYLSTGRQIISTNLSEYNGLDLFAMLKTPSNNEFIQLFTDELEKLELSNSVKAVEARKHFAQSRTYPKQLERIERLISSNS